MANSQAPGDPQDNDIASIANDVRRVVAERPGLVSGGARRDVHRRHHGCVWAWFKILDNIEPTLAAGVFQSNRLYPAWVRFSSSSKREQPDPVGDGRGIAIKLLRSASGAAGELPGGAGLQDFTLLNGPAFFASNAKEMAIVARLEADDAFPSLFFASPARLRGLAALLDMARNQADSLLRLTYHSQVPFQHGPGSIVKYRLRPRRPGPSQMAKVGSAPRQRENYLFEALRDELEPSDSEKKDAERPFDANSPGSFEQDSDVVFDFEVQLCGGGARFPLDDATVVWPVDEQPFRAIAQLRIPRQRLDTVERMAFAELLAFNPWNCLPAHEPLGSLNEARREAYVASFLTREALNRAGDARPSYSIDEWQGHRTNPGKETWKPPAFPLMDKIARGVQAVGALFPWLGRIAARFLSGKWSPALALLPLAGYLAVYVTWPEKLCEPFSLALVELPSETLIPPATLSSKAAHECGLQEDPKWLFRYSATGSERHGGLPYWIYRVLPGMLPEYFGERGDWSQFGLESRDDDEYYSSYHELPRGLVLSNINYRIAGNSIGAPLKVVSFNCASCHRGEYLLDDEKQTRRFIDGMPNLSIDTAAYKVASIQALRDDRFNAESVIGAIDTLLEQEAKRRSQADGKSYPSALSPAEKLLYRLIVAQAKAEASAKPIDWVIARPHNGFGRLDAFGALRFEFMRDVDLPEQHIATVDLPSIWQQASKWRPWHHYDGNTDHPRARNFGAIVGVGGNSLSIRAPEVLKIGKWIDDALPSPAYPFAAPDAAQVAAGERAYTSKCAGCHGLYGRGQERPRPIELPGPIDSSNAALRQRLKDLDVQPCVPVGVPAATEMCDGASGAGDIGTDRKRAVAVDPDFVRRLNAFGVGEGLWDSHSFRSTGRYIPPPLDGIWARAPYLHNGSVPSLWDLLGPATERPKVFYRANPKYDQKKLGFVSDVPLDGRENLKLDTMRSGNCRLGHASSCQRAVGSEREQIIAYLKTL